jgi:hypothetical protein
MGETLMSEKAAIDVRKLLQIQYFGSNNKQTRINNNKATNHEHATDSPVVSCPEECPAKEVE